MKENIKCIMYKCIPICNILFFELYFLSEFKRSLNTFHTIPFLHSQKKKKISCKPRHFSKNTG